MCLFETEGSHSIAWVSSSIYARTQKTLTVIIATWNLKGAYTVDDHDRWKWHRQSYTKTTTNNRLMKVTTVIFLSNIQKILGKKWKVVEKKTLDI